LLWNSDSVTSRKAGSPITDPVHDHRSHVQSITDPVHDHRSHVQSITDRMAFSAASSQITDRHVQVIHPVHVLVLRYAAKNPLRLPST
jgi:hypothetical protein